MSGGFDLSQHHAPMDPAPSCPLDPMAASCRSPRRWRRSARHHMGVDPLALCLDGVEASLSVHFGWRAAHRHTASGSLPPETRGWRSCMSKCVDNLEGWCPRGRDTLHRPVGRRFPLAQGERAILPTLARRQRNGVRESGSPPKAASPVSGSERVSWRRGGQHVGCWATPFPVECGGRHRVPRRRRRSSNLINRQIRTTSRSPAVCRHRSGAPQVGS